MANQCAKERVRRLASRQSGRISWAQLRKLGVARTTINAWAKQGYLHRVLPDVYAVGHDAPSVEADLAAAVLYAGPGAMLSHATAAWWWGLIDRAPSVIHLSTPGRPRWRGKLRVYSRRRCPRTWYKHMPVTTVAQTLLDFAATASLNRLRAAMATAEYRKLLRLEEVEDLLGSGRPGSAKLRKAIRRHQPPLAHTRSPTEVAFFALCEKHGLPLPDVNAPVAGWTVDFFWPRERVVVEVDPYGNHHTPAQVDRDRRKDLALRAANLVVHRYSRDQVEQTAAETAPTSAPRWLSGPPGQAASVRWPEGS